MTRRYAEGTDVSPERSRDELQRLLIRYGVKRSVQENDAERQWYAIQFELQGKWYRVAVEAPPLEDFRDLGRGFVRTKEDQVIARNRELQRRWRVLVLLMKAKLEAVADETAKPEEEFLSYLLLPDGRTYGEASMPEIERMYTTGSAPDPLAHLLPPPPEEESA